MSNSRLVRQRKGVHTIGRPVALVFKNLPVRHVHQYTVDLNICIREYM